MRSIGLDVEEVIDDVTTRGAEREADERQDHASARRPVDPVRGDGRDEEQEILQALVWTQDCDQRGKGIEWPGW